MGTTYTVHDKGGLEIVLDEMSNAFSLGLYLNEKGSEVPLLGILTNGDEVPITGTSMPRSTLTPDDVVGMAIKMIQTSLYWLDDPNAAHRRIVEEISALQF